VWELKSTERRKK